MTAFKSGIILVFMFIEQSTQFSISNETNSELPFITTASQSNQTGCLKTIGQCFRHRPNEFVECAFEHAINNIDCIIASNKTWHVNEFMSLKKNDNWQPTDIEARHDQSFFGSVLSKLSDLIASRSIQFSLPQSDDDNTANGRVKSGFDFFSLANFGGAGGGAEGRKKKLGGKHGMGTLTIVAMMAQLLLGKIAFLAGAALLLSKISLLFSIVNALKKQGGGGIMGGGGGGAEHIIYGADPGGHGGYQRSIIESPTDWVFTDEPPSTFSPIGA